MSELSVQEKLLKLQQMGKLPYDNTPTYLQLAMELADCKTKIAEANKILDEINSPLTLNFVRIDRLREALK
jgi:hypothetical protein